MDKIIIASYRDEAPQLLDALQREGIVELLDAERAMASKEWPELETEAKRPRDLEETVARLERTVKFLKARAVDKDATSLFSPRIEVDKQKYTEVVSGQDALKLLDETEALEAEIDKLNNDYENCSGRIDALLPWCSLETPVEELSSLQTAACISGLVPSNHFAQLSESLSGLGSIQAIGSSGNMSACLTVCMADKAPDVQKTLRAFDFEAVSFEGLSGTAKELLDAYRKDLQQIDNERSKAAEKAVQLARQRLKLQILFDHSQNLLSREHVRSNSAATEYTILLEGWVGAKDYKRLEEIISGFEASSVSKMDIAEGEEVPVEIDNGPAVRPFETVTRLYGMPAVTDVDPTVFFAPFFAIFFGLCMTDAAYGLVMIAFLWWLIKKIKGTKNFMWMMIVCSVTTVIAGALTGGWFGDAVQQFFGEDSGLNKLRMALMLFDPMEKPMYFFTISLALGYFQIIFGIGINFVHKLRRKDYLSAIFDHLSWLVWLNSLLIFGLAKAGMLPAILGKIFVVIAIIPAVAILLFSEREGGWGGRIGMGFYNVFSTVFYVGDVLSYIRLMALGMVTGGFGMAVNEICKSILAAEMPFGIGYIFAGLVFVGMHTFNIANSALSSFVHTMRLQFVEFFTKFIAGGGKDFKPLREEYTHISVNE